MGNPVCSASMDRATYAQGELMTLSVNYSDPDTHTVKIYLRVGDDQGAEGPSVTVNAPVDPLVVRTTDPATVWTKLTDTGTQAVFTADATGEGQVTVEVIDASGHIASTAVAYHVASTQVWYGASATSRPAMGTSSDLAEFNRLEAITGHPLTIRRGFGGVPTTFAAHPCGADVGKRASFASIKTDPVRMRDGLDDALIRTFVQSIPSNHTVYLTWQHEAENPKKGFDPAVIRAAGAHFASLVKSARGVRKVHVAWVAMGWTFATQYSGRNPMDWYWGDDAVEVVAPDPYNTSTTKYYALDSDMVGAKAAYEFAKAHGKRFGLAEWGCYDQTATKRPQFIRDGIAWLESLAGPSCEFAAWFHSDVAATDGKGYWLDTSPASFTEWKNGSI